MRMPSIDEPPCKSLAKSVSIVCTEWPSATVREDNWERVTRRSGNSSRGLFPMKAAATAGGGRAQRVPANSHPFAKVYDARVKIIFSTSSLEKVQENVPLKTPEVTEQLELACIATCLLPVYCKF